MFPCDMFLITLDIYNNNIQYNDLDSFIEEKITRVIPRAKASTVYCIHGRYVYEHIY